MDRPWKKKARKVAAWSLTALMTGLAVTVTVTIGWRPLLGANKRPLTGLRYERTPERLARGKYLVEGVTSCFDCHATPPAAIPQPGVAPVFQNKGAGQVMINQGGLLVAAPNITPDMETGAGSWTDDQFARAIREGIGHDGRALFPLMPYSLFRHLTDEDLASIIVYIRSLPPVHNELPKRKIPFALSRLINAAPQPVTGPVLPDAGDRVSHGAYLTKVGLCADCHTQRDQFGKPLKGMDFAGGVTFDEFGGATSANLTPDPSGIGYFDEELFIKTLRTGHVGARPLRFPMPWWNFRNMSDEDLKSIFAYLRTVPPVHHRVDNDAPATPCKRCNGKHGAGDENLAE